MDPVLSLKQVSFAVGGRGILNDISLDVEARQYFAIAGINGAGKSTMIRLILDLIRPSPGAEITIFGVNNQLPASREKLVYLPEKFDVKSNITGWQYLSFIASIYRQTVDTDHCVALAEKLDFPVDRLAHDTAAYSKGMVQKLGLISCFMLDTPLLILDEPLSGLDPKARYCFKHLMLEQKQQGRTVLYSTHMLADAEELCDQFAILHDGRFKYLGTPADCMATFEQTTLENAYMACINSEEAV